MYNHIDTLYYVVWLRSIEYLWYNRVLTKQVVLYNIII